MERFRRRRFTGITAFGDPLSAIRPPSIGTCVTAPTCDHRATLTPGYYCGLNINSGGSATLRAGIYSFNGAINVNSSATLQVHRRESVSFLEAVTLNSNSSANLSAPT